MFNKIYKKLLKNVENSQKNRFFLLFLLNFYYFLKNIKNY